MKNSMEKFSYALPVNDLVNTLIMKHFIKLVLTFKSVTFHSRLVINYGAP